MGITALLRPPQVHLDLIRREIPFMILVSVVGAGLVAWGQVPRFMGILLFLGLAAYTAYSIRAGRQQSREEPASGLTAETGTTSVWLCSVLIVVGLAVLVAGSQLFVEGAVTLARNFGVTEAVIGLTIVAAGTSLPELATSVVAAVKGESDVAIGNIVGSNVFNLLGILGLTAAIVPIEISGIGLMDAAFMLGLSVLLLPIAYSQHSISRLEGSVFLGIYGAYLYLLWPAT